jgi:hypothetical protein
MLKAALADGRVIVELNDKQLMKVDPEKDGEWKLVGSNTIPSRWGASVHRSPTPHGFVGCRQRRSGIVPQKHGNDRNPRRAHGVS